MAEALMLVFNTSVSSTNVFISSVKHVHLQHQKCLSPAQNAFVALDKRIHLQCDLYLEVSSREYLVTSDERVRLQCESYSEVGSRNNLIVSDIHIRILFGSWFRNYPSKRKTKTRGNKVS